MELNRLHKVIYEIDGKRTMGTLTGLQLLTLKSRIKKGIAKETIISAMEVHNDKTIIEKIATDIIKTVQINSDSSMSGYSYTIDYATILSKYSQQINEAINAAITKELEKREEVADVQEDTDGFDVTLYTDYAPNYIPGDEE